MVAKETLVPGLAVTVTPLEKTVVTAPASVAAEERTCTPPVTGFVAPTAALAPAGAGMASKSTLDTATKIFNEAIRLNLFMMCPLSFMMFRLRIPMHREQTDMAEWALPQMIACTASLTTLLPDGPTINDIPRPIQDMV